MTPAKTGSDELIRAQKLKEETGTLSGTSKETPAKRDTEVSATKTTVTKKKIPKGSGIQRAPRNLMLAEETADYSHIYRNFYDIFVGSFTDQKGFELNFAVRETRNIQASFVNLMENHLLLNRKHQFEKHPLEAGYNAYYQQQQQVPNHLSMVGEKLNELEHMMQTRDSNGSIRQQQKALMMTALSQAQLREKYKQLKNKGQDEINRDALALT